MGDWGLCPEPLSSSVFPSVGLGLLARPEPSFLWGRLPVGRTGRRGRRWGLSPARGPTQDGGGHTAARAVSPAILLASFPRSPISLFSGVVTLFLQVLCGLESRAQGDPLKWAFLPPVASPTTLPPTHPQIRKGRSETQLIDKKLPQPSSGHAGHKSLFSRSRIKGRSRTASQGLWGKLRGPQGRNLSLTSHSATFSLLFSHTHTKLLPSRQCF